MPDPRPPMDELERRADVQAVPCREDKAMTTDPRIAALAEALAVMSGAHPEATTVQRRDVGDYRLGLPTPHVMPTVAEFAAAILAALPPGWCGHDLRAIRNRAWQDGVNAANVDPDLARLRAIEEVNQRTRNWIDQNLAVWSDDEDANSISMAACDLLRKVRNVMDTGSPLRAALGSER